MVVSSKNVHIVVLEEVSLGSSLGLVCSLSNCVLLLDMCFDGNQGGSREVILRYVSEVRWVFYYSSTPSCSQSELKTKKLRFAMLSRNDSKSWKVKS